MCGVRRGWKLLHHADLGPCVACYQHSPTYTRSSALAVVRLLTLY